MAIQDFTTAQEECRVCLAKWRKQTEGFVSLIEDAPKYSVETFVQSVDDRLPRLRRTTRALLARLSILIQVMHEIESEKRARATE